MIDVCSYSQLPRLEDEMYIIDLAIKFAKNNPSMSNIFLSLLTSYMYHSGSSDFKLRRRLWVSPSVFPSAQCFFPGCHVGMLPKSTTCLYRIVEESLGDQIRKECDVSFTLPSLSPLFILHSSLILLTRRGPSSGLFQLLWALVIFCNKDLPSDSVTPHDCASQ